jgi:hypothetical protein
MSLLSVTDPAAIGNLVAEHKTYDVSLFLGHHHGVDYHAIVKGGPLIWQCFNSARLVAHGNVDNFTA